MHDLDELLARISAAMTSEAHTATFAALVGRRFARVLDGDARTIEAALWRAAASPPLASLDVHLASLESIAAAVDPDRLSAPDAWRAIGVLRVALQVAAGRGPRARDLALAALGARALVTPADVTALAARWTWDAVEAEARWLEEIADTLARTASLDAASVATLEARRS